VQAINHHIERNREQAAARRRFVDDASHQLRTPLTTLATQVTFAQRESDPDSQRQALEKIRMQLDETIRQTNQMLSLARADSAPPRRQPFDAAALAESLVRQWWEQAREHGVDLGLDVPDQPIAMVGEPDLLREALANLLHNAIRHAGKGCQVTLKVRGDTAGAVQVNVTDDGPGLPPDELPLVGERFFRGRASVLPGSGLGLAIVRTVVLRHGGQMLVGTGPEGRGLSITLTLPTPRCTKTIAG
jgi:two-component system sensor histidine kinase TctE